MFLWLLVAFFAGCLTWYYVGGWMVRKTFGSEEYRGRMIESLSDDTLVRVEKSISEELLRRQGVLDDRKSKISP